MKIDSFIPYELQPTLVFPLPEIQYPPQINVCNELVDRNVERGLGDKPAVISDEGVITYRELQNEISRISGGLIDAGIGEGDRVLIRGMNRPETLISILAVMRCGAIAVPTMHLLREGELEKIAKDCEPKMAIVQSGLEREIERIDYEFREIIQFPESERHSSLKDLRGEKTRAVSTERDDIALMLYTSGTTGTPKGVIHTHESILSAADTFSRYAFSPDERDIFTGHPSMAFAYCFAGLIVYPLRAGASTAPMEEFHPDRTLDIIEDYQATIFFTVPTAINLILQNETDEHSLESLRAVSSAGEKLPPAILRKWMERFNVPIVENMGTSEILASFISNRVDEIKEGSCGRPVPGYEVRIMDDNMREVKRGEIGYMFVRGPTGARYWKRNEEQKKYVKRGWTYTGDLAWMDEDGHIYYVARVDDVIISSGYRITSQEVENILLEHPAVKEVAVTGVKDEKRGQVPKAFVVLKDEVAPEESLKEELKNFAKSKLAPYKYPRQIEFLKELPKTPTGKIKRRELRNR